MKFKSIFSNIYFILFIIYLVVVLIYSYATYFEKIIIVKNTGIVSHGKTGLNIVTDDKGNAYSVSNSILYGSFKATELYESLEENNKYKIHGYGMRIPILGLYPNIIFASKI